MNATPVRPLGFAFVIVIVRTDMPFTAMFAGAKLFVAVGGDCTLRVAVASAVLAPAFVDVSAPAASVFTKLPVVVGVTVTCTVQEPFAGIVAPVTAMLVPFAAAVIDAPAQVLDDDGVAAFCRFAG